MAESADPTVQQLFKKWRSGDAEAGQTMAQRFSDWYYAITAVRLGDRRGRAPLDRACSAFAQGIVNVTRPGDLTEWAYTLITQEVTSAGGRVPGGDFPNALTREQPPSRLLRQARAGLDPDQVRLLHLFYSGTGSEAEISAVAESQGGMPLALLRARYTLKRWLRTNAEVPFHETPLEIDFDRAPLPYYEAAIMRGADEQAAFERWILSDPRVCRDVAEFAAFALSMRAGGLMSEEPPAAEPPAVEKPATPTTAPVSAPPKAPQPPTTPAPAPKSPGMLLIGGVVVGILLVLVVAWFALR